MIKAIIAAVCLVVVASAITASVLVVVGQGAQETEEQLVGQQGGGQEPPEEIYIPPVKALKPGEVEIPPGTPAASLALPLDYGRFRILAEGVSDYIPDSPPPPGVKKADMDLKQTETLEELRDHDLFIEPLYIPAGWELTWAHAETVIWDDGSYTGSMFALQYDRPEYFHIRINRFLIAPEGQVELRAPPAGGQDALILNEIRGHPAVFLYQGPLQVHFVIDNVVTYVEGVAIDFDELIKIADALIAQTEQAQKPTTAAPPADSSPAPAVTAEPTASPTITQPTRGALGCVDCWVKGGQALRVTAEDVQLGPDGKYYIPDRGDGCAYREDMRGIWELGVEEVVLRAPGCEVFWVYLPATGEVQAWTP